MDLLGGMSRDELGIFFEKYRSTVDRLKVELEQIKRQISSGNSGGMVLPPEDETADVQPGLTPRR